MSRERWIWDRGLNTLVPAAEFYARKIEGMARSHLPAPLLIRDTEPYRSVITGEMIQGRRQHRDHLKAHGCIEVGNEYLPPKPLPELPPIAQDVKRAMEDESVRAEALAAEKRAKEALTS